MPPPLLSLCLRADATIFHQGLGLALTVLTAIAPEINDVRATRLSITFLLQDFLLTDVSCLVRQQQALQEAGSMQMYGRLMIVVLHFPILTFLMSGEGPRGAGWHMSIKWVRTRRMVRLQGMFQGPTRSSNLFWLCAV